MRRAQVLELLRHRGGAGCFQDLVLDIFDSIPVSELLSLTQAYLIRLVVMRISF